MARFNLTSLQVRMISGFTLAPLFGALVYFGGWVFSVVIALTALVALYEFFALARRTDRFLLWLGFGLLYTGLSFYSFYALRQEFPVHLTFLFVFLVWHSDCGAYLTGKLIGGAKMAKSISPNKTWAGLGGATFFPGLLFAGWMFVTGVMDNLFMAFALGFALGIVGQAGDLLISYIKRQADAKDSGALIPGHGGLLDRVDAMMLVVPVYFYIVKFHLVG